MKNKPRILIWDLETGYNQMLGFDLGGKYGTGIPYKNVQKERYIISAAWKWVGENRTYSTSVAKSPQDFAENPHNDFHVVRELWALLATADETVAHYGDQFDTKFFNSRCLYHYLNPPGLIKTTDTYKLAKKKFRLNSYRLDYLARFLGHRGKMKNEWDWWLDAWNGDAKAVKKIELYNRQDIEALEYVYEKLRPWDQAPNNYRLFTGEPVCRNCGSKDVIFRGFYVTKEGKKHKLQCNTCGAWDHISPQIKKKQFPGVE
jgi:hypothetical protein